ncbi:phosphatase PAP2 family protein [Arachidicoccus terrestris]|uniref:phosphatase PAP2 family protein n=1 Tax=Arachidicoccus terrestris TaxID=2875539 RepID=UPI001CC53205|nr:phosphatase PAP2 family protein [Arachidicoccus terrestris]UAY55302.1 phosphatase PAP2 family protein [Arachidicoccus terrestris]
MFRICCIILQLTLLLFLSFIRVSAQLPAGDETSPLMKADSLSAGNIYRYETKPSRAAFAHDSERLVYAPRQLLAPGLLAAAGMATFFNQKEGLKNELVEYRADHFSSFRTKVDNYLQFSPLIANYVLEGLGIPGRTDPANQAVIMLKSEAIMLGTTYLLKTSVDERRPDASNHQSFPSGHTAQAFMAATVLSQQYGYRYNCLPYAAYTMAAGTGLLRMANNKHYICDVLAGAAIGILSVKIAYWTHRYHWGKHAIRR